MVRWEAVCQFNKRTVLLNCLSIYPVCLHPRLMEGLICSELSCILDLLINLASWSSRWEWQPQLTLCTQAKERGVMSLREQSWHSISLPLGFHSSVLWNLRSQVRKSCRLGDLSYSCHYIGAHKLRYSGGHSSEGFGGSSDKPCSQALYVCRLQNSLQRRPSPFYHMMRAAAYVTTVLLKSMMS